MPSEFTITPTPPTTIQLEPGQEGTFSFTVTNQAAPDVSHDVVLVALLVGADGKGSEAGWLTVEPREIRGMSGGKTETVRIVARPTASTRRSEHEIRLVVADKERPNDRFATSSTVMCEVVGRVVPPPPPRKKLPWWVIAAIAGAVVLIGGGIGLQQCLSKRGRCTNDTECPAGVCSAGICRPLVLGAPCRDSCPSPLLCTGSPKRCVEAAGRPCNRGDECETTLCQGGVCTIGGLRHDCTTDGLCGQDFRCMDVGGGTKRCLLRPSRGCESDRDCTSSWCNQGKCARDDGLCGNPDDCRPPLVCSAARQQCLKPNGQACTSNAQCLSGSCVGTVCARQNLALRKPASQSSTLNDGVASRAVDGNPDGNWTHGSLTHTDVNDNAWWQVDLGAVVDIDVVRIYNRTDCCPERLSNFDVKLSNDGNTYRTAATLVTTAQPLTEFRIRDSGRFVRIQLRGPNFLSLAEVEVFSP
jgi:F5/8 type C domain